MPSFFAAQNDLAQQKKNDYVIHAMGTAAQPGGNYQCMRGQRPAAQAG